MKGEARQSRFLRATPTINPKEPTRSHFEAFDFRRAKHSLAGLVAASPSS